MDISKILTDRLTEEEKTIADSLLLFPSLALKFTRDYLNNLSVGLIVILLFIWISHSQPKPINN